MRLKTCKQVVLGCLCGFLAPAFLCRGGEIHTHKAPLYWSVYEYAREMELAGIPYHEMDLSSAQWDAVIDMMSTKFKSHGYDMICTDGFLPQTARDGSVYMTHYGSMPLKTLISKCRINGMRVGVYDNPLWIKGDLDAKVPGTDYTLRSLTRNSQDQVLYPEVTDRPDFTWVVTDHPGAREYIDGFFKHYHDMGVNFVRMDFMCWYEDGDPGRDYPVTCGYGRKRYELGLSYIRESAAKYGIFTSIVMPELYNDAELESKYCNMTRIVQDTNIGGWHHFSSFNRGKIYDRWPYADNQFDGFTHWSHIGGKGKIILDGDFLRLNKCDNDDERRSQVSLQLIAGGPVAIADTPETIGDLSQFYTNDELLALNKDGFVGKPLSDVVNSEKSCRWWGTMTNGDVVIAMFNRESVSRTMSMNLEEIGLVGSYRVRDLWAHVYEESVTDTYKAQIPAHGCKVVRLMQKDAPHPSEIFLIGKATPAYWNIDQASEMLREDDGTFVYSGPLFRGEIRFVSERDWHSVNYMPEHNGTWLTDGNKVEVFNGDPHELAKHWWVNESGTYEVRIKVSASGNMASVSAIRIGDLPPMVTLLGAASGFWESAYAPVIYPQEGSSDIFVWEGAVKPTADRKHFKFAASPGEPAETTFMIPETVDYNGNVKTVKLGETYKYCEETGGGSDHFWGFAPLDCGHCKVIVNKSDKTVSFLDRHTSAICQTGVDFALKAYFRGENLIVESADEEVEVYDLSGRCIVRTDTGRLSVNCPSSGIYIVHSGGHTLKLVK